MKSDLNPINDEVIKADVKALPFESESFSSVMFDPPFVMDTTNHNSEKKGSGIIAKRFSSFDSWAQLKEVYSGGLSEIYRCLKVGGILVFKCQDTVMGRRNYFTHCFVMNAAIEVGFCPKDLFVLMTKNTITGAWENQIHARKHHSFFWVFKKSKNGIHYS